MQLLKLCKLFQGIYCAFRLTPPSHTQTFEIHFSPFYATSSHFNFLPLTLLLLFFFPSGQFHPTLRFSNIKLRIFNMYLESMIWKGKLKKLNKHEAVCHACLPFPCDIEDDTGIDNIGMHHLERVKVAVERLAHQNAVTGQGFPQLRLHIRQSRRKSSNGLNHYLTQE